MDLALIGNGSIQTLIDSKARVQWLCLPRFDSSFVVGPLLDAELGGAFAVEPAEEGFALSQEYLRDTAILVTTWRRAGEAFAVYDFAPRLGSDSPDERPRSLVRVLRPLEGAPRVCYRAQTVYDYGRETSPDGLAPQGEVHLQCSRDVASGEAFALDAPVSIALSWHERLPEPLGPHCEQLLEKTERFWQAWVASLALPELLRDEVVRSAITLKLHQYEDTGAITAASTTSIPEHPGSGRTWDYRFTWPRDSFFTVDALSKLGANEEGRLYVNFLRELSARYSSFQPLYGIAGECDVEEEILEHLAGYRGDGPVRIGNQAYEQAQYDIFGEMIASIEPVFAQAQAPELRELLLRLVGDIDAHFAMPDAGLWEKRDEPARHTFSLLMHWLGARSVRDLGQRTEDSALAVAGEELMARARTCIERDCWNEELGFYTETVGGRYADASLLFMINVGFLAPDDPRAERHLDALCERLRGPDGLFLRYVHDDGLGATHSSFTVCTLWYAEALAICGKREEAETVLRNVLARANHVGLLSEDIDPTDGSLWGNFPQTYSHVGIIRCALALSRRP